MSEIGLEYGMQFYWTFNDIILQDTMLIRIKRSSTSALAQELLSSLANK